MESYTATQINTRATELCTHALNIMKEKWDYSSQVIFEAREEMKAAALLHEFAIQKLQRGDQKSLESLSYSFIDSIGLSAELAAGCWMHAGCPDNALKLCNAYMHRDQIPLVRKKLEKTCFEAAAMRDDYNERNALFELY
jgi:hypothetical protein